MHSYIISKMKIQLLIFFLLSPVCGTKKSQCATKVSYSAFLGLFSPKQQTDK